MMKFSDKKCEPCEGKTKPLTRGEANQFLKDVPGWILSEDARGIYRDLRLKDFMSAVELIQKIAAIAQVDDHHPDIHLTQYRNLRIDLSTHAISGLSENDFILAAKINEVAVNIGE